MGNCIVTPPSQVAVISGLSKSRMVIGQCAFQKWWIESVEYLSLELITLTVKCTEAETVRGVRVTVSGTCQVKVDANADRPMDQNVNQITLACQHFLGKSPDIIRDSLLRTLEGHQRQILGTLTVEELYKDRAAFSQRIREHIKDDLKNMGFALVSYTVTQVTDSQGYMLALGATQTALVKREAAEGESRNNSEAKKRVAEFESSARIEEASFKADAHVQYSNINLESGLGPPMSASFNNSSANGPDSGLLSTRNKSRKAHDDEEKAMDNEDEEDEEEAKNSEDDEVALEDEKKASADRDLQLKKAAFKAEVSKAEAQASVAFDIEKAIQSQQVVKEETKQQVEKAKILLEVQETEAQRVQRQKEGISLAGLIEEKNKAEGVRAVVDAKAHEIKELGHAQAAAILAKGEAEAKSGQMEATAILAKGEAEAKILEMRGETCEHFARVAIMQKIVDRLPDIAREVSAPLAKTEKMIFFSGEQGGSASRLTAEVGNILAQVPATVEAFTGVDMTKGLKRFLEGGGDPKVAGIDPKLAASLLAQKKGQVEAKG